MRSLLCLFIVANLLYIESALCGIFYFKKVVKWCYVNTISVTMKNVAGASGGGEDKRFKKNIEYILVYAKDYNSLRQFSEVCDYIEMPDIIEMYKQENNHTI